MKNTVLIFDQVSFSYETNINPLFQDMNQAFYQGWTGIVGANGTGKTTFLKLASGALVPTAGKIQFPGSCYYCEQKTDHRPGEFKDFLECYDKSAWKIRDRLGIIDQWYDSWPTLSHGERKRIQLAIALWKNPALLAVDEPTNHLDGTTREVIFKALKNYWGLGLLVSHDRDLLDNLCSQCLFIRPPQIELRPGGFSKAIDQEQLERESLKKQYDLSKKNYDKLRKEAVKREQLARQQHKKRSKKGIAKKDHDSKAKKNLARMSGKDGVAGKLLRAMDGRIKHAQNNLDNIHRQKEYQLGIGIPGTPAKRDLIARLPEMSIVLDHQRSLQIPDLLISPRDKIGITGPNGYGKSTLIRHIHQSLTIPADKVVYLPQEITTPTAKTILEDVRQLSNDQLGILMKTVSQLGSRPDRLLETHQPSPGEIRKLLIALGTIKEPHLIIMDEPTNHLDIDSIQCLETALANCVAAFILVSHDRQFLNHLTTQNWNINENEQKSGYYLSITLK